MRLAGRQSHRGCTIRGSGRGRSKDRREPPTPPFSGKTSPQNHHHSLRSAQDKQAKAFHCAVAPATVHRLLLRDSPLPTSRERVAAAAVGKKKVFSCLCDCLCRSNL